MTPLTHTERLKYVVELDTLVERAEAKSLYLPTLANALGMLRRIPESRHHRAPPVGWRGEHVEVTDAELVSATLASRNAMARAEQIRGAT